MQTNIALTALRIVVAVVVVYALQSQPQPTAAPAATSTTAPALTTTAKPVPNDAAPPPTHVSQEPQSKTSDHCHHCHHDCKETVLNVKVIAQAIASLMAPVPSPAASTPPYFVNNTNLVNAPSSAAQSTCRCPAPTPTAAPPSVPGCYCVGNVPTPPPVRASEQR